MANWFGVKPITVTHDPCDPSVRATYTLTLVSPAEPNGGDHVCAIDFSSNRASIDWWMVVNSVDVGIGMLQAFLFTSAGESYTLKARLKQNVQNVQFKAMPYTVAAVYAPNWANGAGEILPSVGSYETSCGVQVRELAECYDINGFDAAIVPDEGYSTVNLVYSNSQLQSTVKKVGQSVIYGRRYNIEDKCSPLTEISGTFWWTTNMYLRTGVVVAKVRTTHPVEGTIIHCRPGYESTYPSWVCTPGAELRTSAKNELFDIVVGVAPTFLLDIPKVKSVQLLDHWGAASYQRFCAAPPFTPAPTTITYPLSTTTIFDTTSVRYGRFLSAAPTTFNINITSAGVIYTGSVTVGIIAECVNNYMHVRVSKSGSFTITYPTVSCGINADVTETIVLGELLTVCGATFEVIAATHSKVEGGDVSLSSRIASVYASIIVTLRVTVS